METYVIYMTKKTMNNITIVPFIHNIYVYVRCPRFWNDEFEND